MTVRPPRQTKMTDKDPLAAALEQEVMSEKASTLSRLTRKLEASLELLMRTSEDPGVAESERLRLQAQAGEALWYVTIQRELCGLREHKAFYDFLKVPRAVRLCMGPAATARTSTGERES